MVAPASRGAAGYRLTTANVLSQIADCRMTPVNRQSAISKDIEEGISRVLPQPLGKNNTYKCDNHKRQKHHSNYAEDQISQGGP